MIDHMQRPTNSAARPRTRTVGRPRALTLDEILDAAIRLGLTNLNMSDLAAELGTSAATLYNYVSNREDLLRLAAMKQAKGRVIDDVGGDWQTLVRNHANSFFELFASEPQLIVQYMQGAMGPDMLLDYVESYLAAMRRRGFSGDDAYRIISDVNTVVFGAAVRVGYLKAMEEKGLGHGAIAQRSLRERDPNELPLLRATKEYVDNERAYNFQEALEHIIAGFTAEFDHGGTKD